jgi:hypothetical protein
MTWLYKRIRDWEGKLNKIDDDLNARVKASSLSTVSSRSKRKICD